MPTLSDRQPVEGTEPQVYIGHRIFKGKNGSRRVSKKWYAEYCIDAKQRHEKLDTSNKNVAIRKAHELAKRIRNNEEAPAKRRVDLAELVKQYMELQNNKGRAPKTIEKYQFVLNQLVTWATEHKKLAANNFTAHDFWSFNKWMQEDGKSDKTRHDRLILVKQLFKWAARTKLISSNPVAGETITEPQPTVQPCFTPEQVGTLLDNADPHEGAIFAVMAWAGLRFGEVQQLQWSDLALNPDGTGFIVVQRGGSSGKTTKGKRTRRIPIHAELRKVIDKLPRDFTTVFTARPSKKHPEGGGLISERRLLVSLKRLCRRCNFPDPDRFKVHTFRHAFASMLARNNVSYKYALEFMGHKSSDILDLYYSMFDSVAATAIGTIDYPRKAVANASTAA